MDKKMITISGIVFALVFIVLMAVIFSNVVGFGNDANANISNIKEAIADADIEQYNDSIVSGDTVISTINKLKETKDGLKMSYAVCRSTSESSSASSWDIYGYKAITAGSTNSLQNIKGEPDGYLSLGTPIQKYSSYTTSLKPGNSDASGRKYISPVAEFKANILFSTNGVVVGIKFVPTT